MRKINLPRKSIASLTGLMILFNTGISFADINKEETVYTILDSNGNIEKTIVSSWINSDDKLGEFKDISNLTNITNVKGEEKPAINGKNIDWNVNEEDLYYKGESKQELPINVAIKYELDGKEIKPDELKGKSGKFKITISLTNNEKRKCTINGKERELYVPFLTATEVLFNRENVKNIKINSGELIDDGKNCSITFASSPGLKESLDLDEEFDKYIDLNDKLVIEGEATSFEAPTIMLAATPQLPELKGLDENSTISDLSKALDDLNNGSTELLDGSKKLLNGNNELSSNFVKFDQGVKSIDEGTNELNLGIDKLISSTPTLEAGAMKLSQSLTQLSNAQNKFCEGVNQYVASSSQLNSAYSQIQKGITDSYAGSTQILKVLGQSNEGLDALLASTNNIDDASNKLNSIASSVSSTNPELAAQLSAISQGLNQVSQGQKGGINNLKSGMSGLYGGVNNLNTGLGKLNEGSNTYATNFNNLVNAGSKLTSNSNQLSQAALEIKAGGEQLAKGANDLNKGASQLGAGSKTLAKGTKELSTNSSKLLNGTNDLAKGSKDLYNGVYKLKSEGLDKIYNKGNTKLKDIENIIDVKDELLNLSKEYNNFSGIEKDMNGKVKFVMKIGQ